MINYLLSPVISAALLILFGRLMFDAGRDAGFGDGYASGLIDGQAKEASRKKFRQPSRPQGKTDVV